VRSVARRARSTSRSDRIPRVTRSSPPPLTPVYHRGMSRKPTPTPTREPPCATTGLGSLSAGTRPTTSHAQRDPAPLGRP
jgi:hypothetical protein